MSVTHKSYSSWRNWAFLFVMFGCVQFFLLTTLAMFFYPGGTYLDPGRKGYAFFMNFFSDLGRTHTLLGARNNPSFILFTIALSLAGLALIIFFLAIPALSHGGPSGRWLSISGSAFGVVSGLSFMGVAFTPADLYLPFHEIFVNLAFTSFFLGVICYLVITAIHPTFPKVYAWVYLGFTVILGVYLLLLFTGPSAHSKTGLTIQATGQKIVGYAAILCMFIQGYGSYHIQKSSPPLEKDP